MPKDTVRVTVPLTERQREIITAAADALGLTLAGYLRMAALERAGNG